MSFPRNIMNQFCPMGIWIYPLLQFHIKHASGFEVCSLLTWAPKSRSKLVTPPLSWSRTSAAMTLPGSPLTLATHPKNEGKHTYHWCKEKERHLEEGQVHTQWNWTLNFSTNMKTSACHLTCVCNAASTTGKDLLWPRLYCISTWGTVNNLWI